MKYLREILNHILEGHSAAALLADLSPQEKGHRGEALLRVLILLGIHPTDPAKTVVPCLMVTKTRRLEVLHDRLGLLDTGLINAGGANKIDVCWKDEISVCVCSSKIGKIRVKSIADLEIGAMLTEFTESGGYTDQGIRIVRESVLPFVLIDNKSEVDEVAERSKPSNRVSKDNYNPLDMTDLERMCCVLRERLGINSLSHLLADEKPALRLRFHQRLVCAKAAKAPTSLIGALPRSGKTYMGAFLATLHKKVLVITTRPSETRSQWNKVFRTHREFSAYTVLDLNSTTSSQVATLNGGPESLIAIASIQFFKMETRALLAGLNWDLVLLDEIHEGGSTTLSSEMLDTYIGPRPIRVMMTATYRKPVLYYAVPESACCFWDLEDVRLMRSWPECLPRLTEKYGVAEVAEACEATYRSGETDESIRRCYETSPKLGILTTIMNPQVYDELRVATHTPDNVYGFSMRSLFMTTKDGRAFQNPKAVDTFLALISGSEKMKHFKKGNMSMMARIERYWQCVGHRPDSTFMTQMWFLPSGVGQLLEHVKPAITARIQANPILSQFAVMTLDAGMGDISKAVHDATIDAKARGALGLILLTGNVGSLGVSLPEVDVAFMLHDVESADMNYQQMMRVLTEDTDKKVGLVVDFNVWRVLTMMTTYVSKSSQKSSTDRIQWCMSHLVDVDADLWDPKCGSPEQWPQAALVDALTGQWRSMIDKTGTTLTRLARAPFDLGEDQMELERIARHLEGGVGPSARLELNEDQDALSEGLETRTVSESASVSASESVASEEIVKTVHLHDVLARLIPELALLSGCKADLLEALNILCLHPRHREALDSFILELYSKKASAISPLNILQMLVRKHYENLTDAREIFEVISSRMGTLDSPKELVAFLGQHLKPKELEKKQNGEVFTPPELIQAKFDALERADPLIWSDPTRKFLDPANGIGNYPALAFHRLMEGLKTALPDPVRRKRHILENMLYMCELNMKNVEVSRTLFDSQNHYALNLFQGSYLDLVPKTVWNVEHFDVVFGNPPYQPPSNGKKGGKSLWPTFVQKSLGHLKPNGFLVFVHPALWRKPENELHDEMFGHQIHTLSIHSSVEGDKMFNAATRFDWYVLQKTPSVKPTLVRYDDNTLSNLLITPALPFIANHGGDVLEKVRAKHSPKGFLKAEMTCEGHTQRPYIEKTKSPTHPYPVFNSSSKTRGNSLCWSSKALTHQTMKKVLFSNGGVIQPFYDVGQFGTTQGGLYIFVDSDAEGHQIVRYLKSKLVSYIIGGTKWSNFETNKQIFGSIPHPCELPIDFTDEQVYAYMGLNADEVRHIEEDQPIGLKTFVPWPVPDIATVGAATTTTATTTTTAATTTTTTTAATTTTVDYSTLLVADLKQLCKDRGIKGITGKKKSELIAMLE